MHPWLRSPGEVHPEKSRRSQSWPSLAAEQTNEPHAFRSVDGENVKESEQQRQESQSQRRPRRLINRDASSIAARRWASPRSELMWHLILTMPQAQTRDRLPNE